MKRVWLLVCAMVLAVPMAQADTYVFDLTFEFSGATPPAGAAPWLRATVEDTGANQVTLTMEALNLIGSEFVTEWYFNLDPFVATAAAAYVSGVMASGVDFDLDGHKADGDGDFDLLFTFPNGPPSARFDATSESVYTITGAGINAADFLALSQNGPVGKTGFASAAHVQGIGTAGNDSGWVAGPPGYVPPDEVIPEPASIFLLGTVLAGVVYRLRRRQAA